MAIVILMYWGGKNVSTLKIAQSPYLFLHCGAVFLRYAAGIRHGRILGREAVMETYLTIEELAGHLKLAEQTIRRWVLNREIPFYKIKKVIRFRLSEIERWVDNRSGGNEGCE